VKTPATRSRFSASVTVSKPKCVGLEGSGTAYSGVGWDFGGGGADRDGRVDEKDRAAAAAAAVDLAEGRPIEGIALRRRAGRTAMVLM